MKWTGFVVVIVTLLGSPRARAEEPATPLALEPGENALETYELNALQLIHVGARDEEGWRPARGKYRRAMSYEDFYRAVGREELAKEHAGRAGLSKMLFYMGWGGLLAGGILFFAGFEEGEPQAVSWVGAGFAGGGLGCVVAGATMDGDPKLDEHEAEALSAQYNAGLRRRLQLGSEPSSLRRSAPRFQLSLAPRLDKSAGFLGMVGKF